MAPVGFKMFLGSSQRIASKNGIKYEEKYLPPNLGTVRNLPIVDRRFAYYISAHGTLDQAGATRSLRNDPAVGGRLERENLPGRALAGQDG
jgi:hypothetical protein